MIHVIYIINMERQVFSVFHIQWMDEGGGGNG